MRVSIIIPAYNEASYIEQTLDAVTKLSYPDYEIIVVDNGSTDDTIARVKKFPEVIVLSETEKRGPNAAREAGFRHATGEIIATLDADSLPPSDWLLRAVIYFKNPRIVGVAGLYDFYDAPSWFRHLANVFQYIVHPPIHWIINTITKSGGIMYGGNSFIRSETLKQIGGFNTNISFYGDDADTAKRLTRLGRIIFSPTINVRSSARRFANQGILKTQYLYVRNFFSTLFHSKPTTHSHTDYR